MYSHKVGLSGLYIRCIITCNFDVRTDHLFTSTHTILRNPSFFYDNNEDNNNSKKNKVKKNGKLNTGLSEEPGMVGWVGVCGGGGYITCGSLQVR